MLSWQLIVSWFIKGKVAGERQRWKEDSKKFADEIKCLVGNCASASAFVSYCGPFNQSYRDMIIKGKVGNDLHKRKIPCNENIDLINHTGIFGGSGYGRGVECTRATY